MNPINTSSSGASAFDFEASLRRAFLVHVVRREILTDRCYHGYFTDAALVNSTIGLRRVPALGSAQQRQVQERPILGPVTPSDRIWGNLAATQGLGSTSLANTYASMDIVKANLPQNICITIARNVFSDYVNEGCVYILM